MSDPFDRVFDEQELLDPSYHEKFDFDRHTQLPRTPFRGGEIVRFKYPNIPMKVIGVIRTGDGDAILCAWLSDDGKVEIHTFSSSVLRKEE